MNTTTAIKEPEIRLTIQPIKDPLGVPTNNRLRRLLKAMLRSYGFRVTSIEDLAQPPAKVGDADFPP